MFPLTRKLNSRIICSGTKNPQRLWPFQQQVLALDLDSNLIVNLLMLKLYSRSHQTDIEVIEVFYLEEDKKYHFTLLRKTRSVHFLPLHFRNLRLFFASTYHRLFRGQIHSQHQSYTGLVTLDYSCDLVLCGPVSHRQILLFWHLKQMFIWNYYCHSKHTLEIQPKKWKQEIFQNLDIKLNIKWTN